MTTFSKEENNIIETNFVVISGKINNIKTHVEMMLYYYPSEVGIFVSKENTKGIGYFDFYYYEDRYTRELTFKEICEDLLNGSYWLSKETNGKFTDVYELCNSFGKFPLMKDSKLQEAFQRRSFTVHKMKDVLESLEPLRIHHMTRDLVEQKLKETGVFNVGMFRVHSKLNESCNQTSCACLTVRNDKGFAHYILYNNENGYYQYVKGKQSRYYKCLRDLANALKVQFIIEEAKCFDAIKKELDEKRKEEVSFVKPEQKSNDVEKEEDFIPLNQIMKLMDGKQPQGEISKETLKIALKKIPSITSRAHAWLSKQ